MLKLTEINITFSFLIRFRSWLDLNAWEQWEQKQTAGPKTQNAVIKLYNYIFKSRFQTEPKK